MTPARTFAPLMIALAGLLGAGPSAAMGQTAPAGADPAPVQAPGPGRGEGLPGKLAERLQLTAAQQASWKEIRGRHQEALAAKAKAAGAARRAWFEALRKPETGADTLKALHRSMADLDLERTLERRSLRQELLAVLTPAQREQAARLEGRMEGRMEGLRMARRMGARGMRGAGCPGAAEVAPPPAPAVP